jgi:cytochrome P450
MTPATVSLDEIALSDLDFWTRPLAEIDSAFATLRAEGPMRFFAEAEVELLPRGPGYVALTRHADVVEASRHPGLYCSGRGTNIGDMPPAFNEFFGSMINMDDPRHARMRRIVSRGFTPRQLGMLQGDVEGVAAEIVDDIAATGSCDLVTEVAALLPLRIILDLMGIPRSEERLVFDRTNVILGLGDAEYVPDQTVDGIMTAALTAGQELADLVSELGTERQRNPGDDLVSALVTAELDGEVLTPEELGSFFILLVVAGNETTRNAIAHGVVALAENPDQRRIWADDLDGVTPTAVEEVVRWATPVTHFRRTVTEDGVRLGDRELSEGDKVVLWYRSANRDEAVFDDPFRFDVRRSPNDHLGFGGPGPHFCLGAHLARREVGVMMRELLARLPDLEPDGPPQRLRSNFINGIKHLPVTFTPTR